MGIRKFATMFVMQCNQKLPCYGTWQDSLIDVNMPTLRCLYLRVVADHLNWMHLQHSSNALQRIFPHITHRLWNDCIYRSVLVTYRRMYVILGTYWKAKKHMRWNECSWHVNQWKLQHGMRMWISYCCDDGSQDKTLCMLSVACKLQHARCTCVLDSTGGYAICVFRHVWSKCVCELQW